MFSKKYSWNENKRKGDFAKCTALLYDVHCLLLKFIQPKNRAYSLHCFQKMQIWYLRQLGHKYVWQSTLFYIADVKLPPRPHFYHLVSISSCALNDCIRQPSTPMSNLSGRVTDPQLLRVSHTFAYKYVYLDTLLCLYCIFTHITKHMHNYLGIYIHLSLNHQLFVS